MKKKEMKKRILELEEQVAALQVRVQCLEVANTCHKYKDLGGNWPYKEKETYKYNWWENVPMCKSSYSVREFV